MKDSQSLFPVVFEVEEDESRCFNFNVAEKNDVNLIILPLPHEKQIEEHDLVETWYVQQVHKMIYQSSLDSDNDNNHSSGPIPNQILGRVPPSIEKVISPFQRGVSRKVPIKVSIGVQGVDEENPKIQYDIKFKAKYFEPLVLNNLRRQFSEYNQNGDNYLMSVRLCIINEDEEELVHVVFGKILNDDGEMQDHAAVPIDGEVEEEETPESVAARARFEKDKHLSPLETSLQRSINKANTVLRDMKFMELREKRLRITSENINTRIRWIAYFSVTVLLAVTFMQVTYLKAYFHKKKVL
jgi:hypothetical protein